METVLVIAIVLMVAGPCVFALVRRGRRPSESEAAPTPSAALRPVEGAIATVGTPPAAPEPTTDPQPAPATAPEPPPSPELSGQTVADLLLPASQIVWLEADSTVDQALDRMIASPHSGYVVADGSLANPRGVIGIRALADTARTSPQTPLGELAHAAHVTSPSQAVESLLDEMRERDEQLAVVLDDHGAVTGAITVEDILEELVGELHDDDLIAELEPGQS